MIDSRTASTTCLVCDEIDMAGVWVGGFYICPDCEERILHTTPDGEDYEELVKGLRPLGAAALRACAPPALEADRPT